MCGRAVQHNFKSNPNRAAEREISGPALGGGRRRRIVKLVDGPGRHWQAIVHGPVWFNVGRKFIFSHGL
jgi:hypothetical protein